MLIAEESAGEIALDLVLNDDGFKRQVGGLQQTAEGAAAKLKAPLKKIAAMFTAALATKKLADFGKSCIDLGSNLAEVQNVVDVTFPAMSKQVDKFAKNAIRQFGLSETMAKQFTGTFGAMAKAFGFGERQAYEMSAALTGLSGDVASFYNITQEEAYTKLKSVFTGETESLKDLGIVMTQTALDSYALDKGFGKTTSAMSEMEKVALRYYFVQDKLNGAAGDFTRTSSGWANQVRVLSLQFDSLKATIGQGLINVLAPVLKLVNMLVAHLQTAANAFRAFTEMISGNKSEDVTASMTAAQAATAGMAENTGATADAAQKISRVLAGFDKLNNISGATAAGVNAAAASIPDFDFGRLPDTAVEIPGKVEVNPDFEEALKRIQKAIEPTKTAIKKLNTALKPLKTFTAKGLKSFYEKLLKPLGKWTLGKGLPKLVDTFRKGLEKVDFDRINEKLDGVFVALEKFGEDVGEGLLWIWENLLVPLGTWAVNDVAPEFLDLIRNALDGLDAIITAAKPGFEWLWENFLEPVAKWTGGVIVTVLHKLNEKLEKFSDWCRKHPGVIENITKIVGAFAAAFLLLKGNTVLANNVLPKAASAVGKLKDAFGLLTSPLGLAVGAFAAVSFAVMELHDHLDEVFSFLDQKSPELSSFLNKITDAVGWTETEIRKKNSADIKVKETKENTVKNLNPGQQALANLPAGKKLNRTADAVSGRLAKRSTAKETEENTTKKPNLGKISPVKLPSLEKLDSIPHLAAGGYVKANTPRLALIGDNKSQGEIVAPEGMLEKLLSRAKGEGSNEQLEIMALMRDILTLLRSIRDKEVKAIISKSDVYRAYQEVESEEKKRRGR